ncbi:DNA repair protein RAD57 [Coccidioides immitis RS]|uniref:DNA repair protein RAD57 n=3 Tax=Coccidioides immitis TaxID=5501 RepID=J3K943_COCIM|nr:DNA repair protein RAD57 [Coccidioides immitis RS]EAS31390.3 DNA repair protein RAD57 [Coccidioides immitis RS]KMP04031.1 RAD57 protein [Coccidioides immitis RMSCC 2394]KMU86183.1 RAD57 protein [Coccidioides immitis H538.4]TPX24190.1 hypothetical protein DIZ76_013533 [Coccidioides immitis]
MDLLTTLPDFAIEPYSHIVPALEKAELSLKELLLLDTLEIAKRTRIPVAEVQRLTSHVLEELHRDLGLKADHARPEQHENGRKQVQCDDIDSNEDARAPFQPPSLSSISTLDPLLDDVLSGGILTGYVTEIAGESGSGKTQLLLHLLLSVQLPPPYGLRKNALYISTEADLATNRLSQLLDGHPLLISLPEDVQRPSLDNVLSITTVDLETQDHILNYHVPAAISRYNVGLVVIDSITANYRVESSTNNVCGLLDRAWELKRLGQLLRNLAVTHNIAVVVANQISDRLSHLDGSVWAEEPEYLLNRFAERPSAQPSSQYPGSSQQIPSSLTCQSPTHPDGSPYSLLRQAQAQVATTQGLPALSPNDDRDDTPQLNIRNLSAVLSFAYQQPFYTGWGDPYERKALKTPALGLVWANQLGCRLVLKIHESSNILSTSVAVDTGTNLFAELSDDHRTNNEIKKDPSKLVLQNQNGDVVEAKGPNQEPGGNQTKYRRAVGTKEEPESQFFTKAPGPESGNDNTSYSTQATVLQTRKRTMQVVFSPWTSGNHISKSEEDPKRSTTEDSNTSDLPSEAVEFEILPSGIRGVTFSVHF